MADRKMDAEMRQLQATGFALHEAALYLDAHPGNTEALRYHAKMAEEYKNLRSAYEAQWGALTTMDAPAATATTGMWNWTLTPWPWELAYPDASDNPENNKMREGK